MIVCPDCGSPTGVRETRSANNYIRRRRVCSNTRCNGRVTTFEIVVSKKQFFAGDVAVIPRVDLEAIASLTSKALSAAQPNAEPDDSDDTDDGFDVE